MIYSASCGVNRTNDGRRKQNTGWKPVLHSALIDAKEYLVRIGFIILLLIGAISATSTSGCSKDQDDFRGLMNRGKAHLENRDALKAVEALSQAVKINPNSAPALRNLARAHRLAKDHAAALSDLNRAATLDSDSAATVYLKALTLVSLSRPKDALPLFERAVRLDANTAALRFQLASSYDLNDQPEKAAEQLRETVRLDHLHAAAHFKLATHARRAGDTASFQRHTREFMRLRELFGDETRSGEALELCAHTNAEAPSIKPVIQRSKAAPVIDVRFQDVTGALWSSQGTEAVATAAVFDVDESGRATLFALNASGNPSLLSMPQSGTMEQTAITLTWSNTPLFSFCRVGDFHDDVPEGVRYDATIHTLQDVLLGGAGGVRLLKNAGSDGFRDVTKDAGLGGLSANAAVWVDYEHDGDLDLLLTGDRGLELWQNKGNGSFENVTTSAGITPTGRAVDVAVADLDGNVSIDIIVARGDQPTLVFENQRAGQYKKMLEPPGPWPAAKRVLVDDVNNDGAPDTVLVQEDKAVVLFGRSAERQTIDLSMIDVRAAKLVDYDNDGWLDFCVGGTKRGSSSQGSVVLLRNIGSGWTDVMNATGLSNMPLAPVVDVLAVDIDNDGDTDLLPITSKRRMHLLRNEGGQVNGQLKARLISVKTNPSGLGTHVEVRDDDLWLTRLVSEQAIEIGLAGRKHLDSIQTVWTNGVVDNQIDVAVTNRPVSIKEKLVPTGSCPFLYAWDGRRFRFVTDLLGNAPIGLPLKRGVMLPADSDEIVTIGTSLPARDGAYQLVVTDEFREILYLDEAKLMAVDHPHDVELHPTDKIMPPPFPHSEVWAMRGHAAPISVLGDDGIDRTQTLSAIDGDFAPPGLPLPSPYRGMCHPLTLTMDFGPVDAGRPNILALTGWLQYGDGSTNISLGQNPDVIIIPPMLEVQATDGNWRPVDVIVGMPAGKTKTILCDLTGKLPTDARRLRLTTTFEIRWDRLALGERISLPGATSAGPPHHELRPNRAHLQRRGFSEIKSRGPGHPRTPAFDIVSDRPPWRNALQGWHTRYGDVLELVQDRDDRLAIIGAGDALTLSFDAHAWPDVPSGLVRTFFFYSVGWDKDGDHNVVTGDTVDPLPISYGATPTSTTPTRSADDPNTNPRDWRLEYNTRWIAKDQFRPDQ